MAHLITPLSSDQPAIDWRYQSLRRNVGMKTLKVLMDAIQSHAPRRGARGKLRAAINTEIATEAAQSTSDGFKNILEAVSPQGTPSEAHSKATAAGEVKVIRHLYTNSPADVDSNAILAGASGRA